MSNFIKRTIVGALMIAVICLAVYLGGPYLGLLLLGLTLVGLYEWLRAFSVNETSNYLLLSFISISCYLEYFINSDIKLSIGIGMALLFLYYLFTNMEIKSLAVNVLGLFYIGRGFLSLWAIKDMYYIILVFLLAFSTDTFAYIVGMTIGKNKLAPTISPNKSIEGAIGGVIGSTVITTLYLYKLSILKSNILLTIIVLAVTSIFSQSGDLFASKIKRELNVKDYGRILPGHGGVLDRFDSVLFVAPIIYLYHYFV